MKRIFSNSFVWFLLGVFMFFPGWKSYSQVNNGLPVDSITIFKSAVGNINPEDAEMLPIADFDLDELKIRAYRFVSEKLRLGNKKSVADTAGWMELKRVLTNKRIIINEYLSTLDVQLCKAGDRYLSAGDTANAVRLYNHAVEVNRFYIPAYIKITRIMTKTGQTEASERAMMTIYGLIYQNSRYHELFSILLSEIYEGYLAEGNHHYKNEQYTEAMQTFLRAEEYCRKIKEVVCDSRLSEAIEKSMTGICRSLYYIARKALTNGYEDLANQYATQALNFRISCKREIGAGKFSDEYYTVYIDMMVEKAKLAKKDNEYGLSEYYFKKALSLADSLVDPLMKDVAKREISFLMPERQVPLTVNTKKMKKMPQAKQPRKTRMEKNNTPGKTVVKTTVVPADGFMADYQQLMEACSMSLSGYSYESARVFLDSAWMLQKKYSIKDKTMDSLTIECIKPGFIRKISDALFEVWKNNLDSARMMYLEAGHEISYYKLEGSPYFHGAMEMLDKKIKAKRCENKANSCKLSLNQAGIYIKNKQYAEAVLILDTLVSGSFHKGDCTSDTTEAHMLLHKYRPAADYQRLVKQALVLYSLKDFDQSIETYAMAESLFMEKRLLELGVVHNSLLDFASNTNDESFMILTLKSLLSAGECHKCLKILHSLKNAGCRRSSAEDVQVKTAECLAAHDLKMTVLSNPENLFISLNAEGEWFVPFRKALIKKMKTVQKNN